MTVKAKQSLYRPGRPWGFQEVEASRFHYIRHIKIVRLSAVCTGRLYPQEIFLILISARGWFDPRTILQPEVLYQCGPGSVVGIATAYGLDGPGIESRCGEIFRTSPDRPCGPPSLLYNGYWVFPGGKVLPGRDADPSPPSSAQV